MGTSNSQEVFIREGILIQLQRGHLLEKRPSF